MEYQYAIGIDVSSASMTVASVLGTHTVPNTPEGAHTVLARLQARSQPLDHYQVALEATGAYWMEWALLLYQAGLRVAVLNPLHVHYFAKSQSRRAKTDPADAELLRQLAAQRPLDAWTPPAEAYHQLRQRLQLRDQLLTMRGQLTNQLHALRRQPVVIAAVVAHMEGVVAELQRRCDQLSAEISQELRMGAWAEEARLLQTIPGIGPLIAAMLLVVFAQCPTADSAEQISAYLGFAPLAHDSGTQRGRRHISAHGPALARKLVYQGAVSGSRWNPVLQAFGQRLAAAGKPVKVWRIACARKLIHLAWAIYTKRQPFDPAIHKQHTERRRDDAPCAA